VDDGGDGPLIVCDRGEGRVVQCAARRNRGVRIVPSFVDGRDTPAVAVHLGQRNEVLQHTVADGVGDSDRVAETTPSSRHIRLPPV